MVSGWRQVDVRVVRGISAALLVLALLAAAVPARAASGDWDVSGASAASIASAAFASRHADGGSHRSPHTAGLSYAAAAASTILCAKVAAKAGYSFHQTVATSLGPEPQIIVAIAVAMAESSCNPHALNVNSGGSRDRGLWQMNSVYHSEVSDACAFQIQCNADAAWNASSRGTDWKPWSAFANGSWKTYVADAKAAISGGFTFQLISSGARTCLAADKSRHADGAPVWQWACDAADAYQQWTVVAGVGAPPVLRNAGAGTCLEWDAAKAGDGQPIFQASCDAADAGQQVSFLGSGRMNVDGEAQALLRNSHAGTCVDADETKHANETKHADETKHVNGASIRQWTCAASDGYQMWD